MENFVHYIALILTLIVILEHLFIVWMEMFAWETMGRKVFGGVLKRELFKPTKAIDANQGLYNGFLVAGLTWSFCISNPEWAFNVRLFFLSCVVVAGTYGALTASKNIFIVQAVPAIAAIIFLFLSV